MELIEPSDGEIDFDVIWRYSKWTNIDWLFNSDEG